MASRLAITVLLLCACATTFEGELRGGQAALERGDHVNAASRLETALALASGQDPWARYEVLIELGEVYLTYVDLGREDRAGELFEAALEIASAHLPPGHPARLDALDRLGRYYAMTGQWRAARPLLEEFMRHARGLLDPETLYASEPAGNLLTAYRKLGARDEYEELRRRREEPLYYAQIDDTPVEEIAASDLSVAPNARDGQGRPIHVHFTRDDMPLRVSMDTPQTPAVDSSLEETRQAVRRGILLWKTALRRLFPSFDIRFVEPDEGPHVMVQFKRSGRYYLPAVGEIEAVAKGGRIQPRGRITLSAQPIPNPRFRITRGELSLWSAHAFGSALGLPDTWRDDSLMSMNWRRAGQYQITDRDLRTFEALLEIPNGQTDLEDAGKTDTETAGAGVRAGVLADLPMISSGDRWEILVDLAPPGSRSFPLQLDTGAADTVLTTDYARALGISVRAIKSDAYRQPTLTGDPLTFWVTAQGGALESRHFDYALLGGEYLREYVVDLDFERRRVRLLDPEIHGLGDETTRLAGEQIVELEVRDTRPFARLELGNGAVWALVDTGAYGSIMLTEEKARELGIAIDPEAERVHVVNVFGFEVDRVQTISEARLGDVLLRDAKLMIGSRPESGVRVTRWLQDETILGLEVLHGFRVRIDYRHGVMGLTPIERVADES